MRTARHTGIACLAVLFCMLPSALGVLVLAPTRWDARLEALDPTRPLDYFLLGEEVADAATNEAERQLARELFGLAGALDRDRLARSAALGRASLASTPLEKHRMQAAAALLGGTQYVSGAGGIEPAKALALARALSYYRIGRGQVALATIRAASAESLLDEFDAMIPGGREGFERECRTLRGGTRPVLDNAALRRMLLLEAALLMPPPRPLSIDVAITGGAPLVEIDVSDLGALFRVDPKIAWWREGRWNVSL